MLHRCVHSGSSLSRFPRLRECPLREIVVNHHCHAVLFPEIIEADCKLNNRRPRIVSIPRRSSSHKLISLQRTTFGTILPTYLVKTSAIKPSLNITSRSLFRRVMSKVSLVMLPRMRTHQEPAILPMLQLLRHKSSIMIRTRALMLKVVRSKVYQI